jgi:hypothetical protein
LRLLAGGSATIPLASWCSITYKRRCSLKANTSLKRQENVRKTSGKRQKNARGIAAEPPKARKGKCEARRAPKVMERIARPAEGGARPNTHKNQVF